jgi:hypothetical protein
MGRRAFGVGVLAFAGMPMRASAAPDMPRGAVVLTITGRVQQPNLGATAVFDMAMLQALPQHSFVTQTPWYDAARKFTGPLLRDVLAVAGAKGHTLRAQALNDYTVDLPYEDTQRFAVLLARLLDDKPMSVRDKGPLFIIYPFDSNDELRNAVYYSRSTWQLKSLDVQ